MANVKPIRTDADLEAAMARFEAIWPKNQKFKSQAQADEFEILSILIEDYEKKHHPMPPPTPLAAIRFEMENRGLNATQLGEKMGVTRSRASEVLSGKRALSISMIRRLVETLDMDASVLIGALEENAA